MPKEDEACGVNNSEMRQHLANSMILFYIALCRYEGKDSFLIRNVPSAQRDPGIAS